MLRKIEWNFFIILIWSKNISWSPRAKRENVCPCYDVRKVMKFKSHSITDNDCDAEWQLQKNEIASNTSLHCVLIFFIKKILFHSLITTMCKHGMNT
jgi:hypothetical protein